jgi:hypothetical protein
MLDKKIADFQTFAKDAKKKLSHMRMEALGA